MGVMEQISALVDPKVESAWLKFLEYTRHQKTVLEKLHIIELFCWTVWWSTISTIVCAAFMSASLPVGTWWSTKVNSSLDWRDVQSSSSTKINMLSSILCSFKAQRTSLFSLKSSAGILSKGMVKRSTFDLACFCKRNNKSNQTVS